MHYPLDSKLGQFKNIVGALCDWSDCVDAGIKSIQRGVVEAPGEPHANPPLRLRPEHLKADALRVTQDLCDGESILYTFLGGVNSLSLSRACGFPIVEDLTLDSTNLAIYGHD